jgi:hypothetical protein
MLLSDSNSDNKKKGELRRGQEEREVSPVGNKMVHEEPFVSWLV